MINYYNYRKSKHMEYYGHLCNIDDAIFFLLKKFNPILYEYVYLIPYYNIIIGIYIYLLSCSIS